MQNDDHVLGLSAVPHWRSVGPSWFPDAADIRCGHCGRFITLTFSDVAAVSQKPIVVGRAQCSGCKGASYVIAVEPGAANDTSQQGNGLLFVYPALASERHAPAGIEAVPEKVRRAYLDALKTYNGGVWSATGTLCRRALEGLVFDLLQDDSEGRRDNLSAAIRALPERVELAKPLLAAAELLRKGGNMATHFEPSFEPDKETAEAMMDLVDYLLEYLYTLPIMVERLRQKVEPST